MPFKLATLLLLILPALSVPAAKKSFGNWGSFTSDPSGSNNEYVRDMAIDGTSMYLVGTDRSTTSGCWRIEKRSLEHGTLDATFNGDGLLQDDLTADSDDPYAIAIDATHMYIAGSANGAQRNLHVAKRRLDNGNLETAFDGDGFVSLDPSGAADEYLAIAIDATHMYLAGYDSTVGSQQWRIEKRLLTTGALDAGFGGGGIIQQNFSAGNESAQAIAVSTSDSSIFVGGFDYAPGNAAWRIQKRRMDTGALIAAFDSDGEWAPGLTGGDDIVTCLLVANNALYAGGYDTTNGAPNYQWRLEKHNLTTGALDTAFDGDGIAITNPTASNDGLYDLASDGTSLYAAGYDSAATFQWRIEKRDLATGALVAGFGTAGVVLNDVSSGIDLPYTIVTDSTFVYIGGFDANPGQWRMDKRFLTDGGYDDGFDSSAVASGNVSAMDESIHDIAIDSTYMYLVGEDFSGGGGHWRIEKRNLSDGRLVPAFDGDGVVSMNFSTGRDLCRTICIDSTFMYLGGFVTPGDTRWYLEKRSLATGAAVWSLSLDNPGTAADCWGVALSGTSVFYVGSDNDAGNNQWRIEKRNQSDGALDLSFVGTGILQENPGVGSDAAVSISVLGTDMFIGGYATGSAEDWRIVKRSTVDGSFVMAFGGGDGVVTYAAPLAATDAIRKVVVAGGALYVGGNDTVQGAGNYEWRIEKRDLASGALDTAFDTDGIVLSDGGTETLLAAMASDGSSLFIAGFDDQAGIHEWRIEKRSLTTGALVGGFGTAGVVQSNPSGNVDQALAIAVNATYLFVGGFDSAPGNGQWRLEKRFASDGAPGTGAVPDPGFDAFGVILRDPSAGADEITALVDDGTSMFVVGFDSSAGDRGWRIEKRFMADGTLDPAFDGDGILQSNPSVLDDQPEAAVLVGGALYVAGYDRTAGPTDATWRIERRSAITGALDPAFDTDGIWSFSFGGVDDIAMAIATDGAAIYVSGQAGNSCYVQKLGLDGVPASGGSFDVFGGIQTGAAASRWNAIVVSGSFMYIGGINAGNLRVDVRNKTTGALAPSGGFGPTYSPGVAGEVTALAVDATAIYIWSFGAGWRFDKRILATGNGDSGFGTGGTVAGSGGYLRGLAAGTNTFFVAGSSATAGNSTWRVVKWLKATGAVGTDFGASGIYTPDPSTGFDLTAAVVLDSTYAYLAGHETPAANSQWRIERVFRGTDPGTPGGPGGGSTSNDIAADLGCSATARGSMILLGVFALLVLARRPK